MITAKQHDGGLANWIKHTFSVIQEGMQVNLTEPPVKIANVRYDKTKKITYITLQMSGKNNYPTLTASEILEDSTLIKMFLEDDSEYIKALVKRDKYGITCRLLKKNYGSTKNEFQSTFTVLHVNNDIVEVKNMSIHTLTQTFNINQFDSQDAFIIGLALADC